MLKHKSSSLWSVYTHTTDTHTRQILESIQINMRIFLRTMCIMHCQCLSRQPDCLQVNSTQLNPAIVDDSLSRSKTIVLEWTRLNGRPILLTRTTRRRKNCVGAALYFNHGERRSTILYWTQMSAIGSNWSQVAQTGWVELCWTE